MVCWTPHKYLSFICTCPRILVKFVVIVAFYTKFYPTAFYLSKNVRLPILIRLSSAADNVSSTISRLVHLQIAPLPPPLLFWINLLIYFLLNPLFSRNKKLISAEYTHYYNDIWQNGGTPTELKKHIKTHVKTHVKTPIKNTRYKWFSWLVALYSSHSEV